MLLLGLGELLAAGLELALAVEELAVALLEHVGPKVELLVAGEQTALQAGELRSLGPGFVLGLALQPELLVLGLEDQFLLLGARLRDDACGFVLGALDGLVGNLAASQETNDHAHGKGGHSGCGHKGDFHINLPPVRPMTGPEVRRNWLGRPDPVWARSRGTIG